VVPFRLSHSSALGRGATSSGDVASLGYPVTFLGSGCKTKPVRACAGLKDPGFGGA
jgi:hypothetical protein